MWAKRTDARLRLAAARHALGDLETAPPRSSPSSRRWRDALGRRSGAARPDRPPRRRTRARPGRRRRGRRARPPRAGRGRARALAADRRGRARAAGVRRRRPREPHGGGSPARRRRAPPRRDRLPVRARARERSRLARDLATARDGARRRRLRQRPSRAATASRIDDAIAYARRARGERKRPSHGWDGLTPDGAPGRRPRHRAGSPTPRSPSSSSSAGRP